MTTYTINGTSYYQQFRKCGKSNCETCTGGDGHGPYWYGRSSSYGQVKYIGKELPAELVEAIDKREASRAALEREMKRLLAESMRIADEVTAIHNYLAGMEIDNRQQDTIEYINRRATSEEKEEELIQSLKF